MLSLEDLAAEVAVLVSMVSEVSACQTGFVALHPLHGDNFIHHTAKGSLQSMSGAAGEMMWQAIFRFSNFEKNSAPLRAKQAHFSHGGIVLSMCVLPMQLQSIFPQNAEDRTQ